MGIILGITSSSELLDERLRLFAVVELLGRLSTYSAFSGETFTMMQEYNYLGALLNSALNTGLSLTFVALGWWITTTAYATLGK